MLRDVPAHQYEQLTPRQRDVLSLLARDRTNQEIAYALDISPETVKTHVSEILGKLGVESREQAAAWYRHERSLGVRLSRSLGWLGRHLPLAAGATAITVVVGAAVAIAIARSGDEPASGGEAPSSDATLARATPATSPTPSPTPPVATPPRAVGIAACPDPDQSLCEFAAALENAWQKHAPIGELVAVSRGRDGSCGHTLEMNQADTCYGAGPGQSFADARFVTELENGDLTRFRPENYQAWLQRYRGSLSMSSPEGHDAFGPASVRVYSLGPGDAAICPGECRTIVMSGRYGPVEGDPKGTPAERHVILLTVEKGASGWAVVDTRYGEQSASQLEQLLHAHQPGFSEWWTEEHANWRPVP